MDTIKNTATALAALSAPVNSSCWLQSRFLGNIASEYASVSRVRPTEESRSIFSSEQLPMNLLTGTASQSPGPEGPVPLRTMQGWNNFDGIKLNYAWQNSFAGFADDAAWETMFENAGFDISGGAFIPDTTQS